MVTPYRDKEKLSVSLLRFHCAASRWVTRKAKGTNISPSSWLRAMCFQKELVYPTETSVGKNIVHYIPSSSVQFLETDRH